MRPREYGCSGGRADSASAHNRGREHPTAHGFFADYDSAFARASNKGWRRSQLKATTAASEALAEALRIAENELLSIEPDNKIDNKNNTKARVGMALSRVHQAREIGERGCRVA